MINVYKAGGPWKTESGIEYTVKSINLGDKSSHISDGWKSILSEVKKPRTKKVIKDDNEK